MARPGMRALGAAGFAAAAAGGIGFGLLARRRAADWNRRLDADPEWAELARHLPARSREVTSFDGTVLHAEVSGPDGAPVVLLVHGYALGLGAWHYQRRDLTGEFQVIAYDQRGHGLSGRAAAGDYSVTALGRDLAAVIADLVPLQRSVLVVGHSLGGMSILAFAKEFPERVGTRLAGAVFCDTTGSDTVAGAFASTGVAALSAFQRDVRERGRRLLRRGTPDLSAPPPADLSTLITATVGFGPSPSPAQVAFVEQLTIATPTTVKADLGPTLSALDLRDAAPAVRVPALVLVGEHDRLTPPAAAARLARALPDATCVEVPGAGHNAMLEAADFVTGEIRAFAHRCGLA